jgi:flagellar biosynthetic protein FliR
VDLNHINQVALSLLERLDVGWTFLLLATRYLAFLMFVPGLGGGITGMALRYPAGLVLALVSFKMERVVGVPPHMLEMILQLVSEVLLGAVVALVPMLIVAGAQTAGHLATGTMGLNGAQMFDPATSTPLSDLSRLYSDITILVFLLIGGHYIALAELAGLSVDIRPGSFVLSGEGLRILIDQSARIFQIGCLIAGPVIAALLLTNFVMGIISKAIPTVNIFIISFPLTIGVGFAISILALPEVIYLLDREFQRLPELLARLLVQ